MKTNPKDDELLIKRPYNTLKDIIPESMQIINPPYLNSLKDLETPNLFETPIHQSLEPKEKKSIYENPINYNLIRELNSDPFCYTSFIGRDDLTGR